MPFSVPGFCKYFQYLLFILIYSFIIASPAQAQSLKAFPTAEGFGSQTVGGRGGKVFEVTNLNDSGAGSLRECVAASGPRICVFRTGGTISLASDLSINNPYITIAGQTAPGGGITLRNGGVFVRTHDVVIRYLTVRRGPGGENYAYLIGKPNSDQIYNIVIDHSSTSWATDQTVTTWWLTRDATIQWIIVSESLDCSTHSKGCHSKALHIGGYKSNGGPGAQDISVHHNLLAHYGERGPDLTPSHSTVDVVNNVAYNAKWTFAHLALNSTFGTYGVNFVKNYYKYGPSSTGSNYEIGIDDKGGSRPEVYLKGNIGPHRPTDNLVENLVGTSELRRYVVNTRFPAPAITETSAFTAYDQVLADAGNNKGLNCDGNWFYRRDAIDTRIVNEVKTGTGRIIDNPSQVGGWISIEAGTPCPDSDHDGMPNAWESKYGFNPNNPADGPQDTDGDGYTNLEEYLNGGDTAPPPGPTPTPGPLRTPTPTSALQLTPTPTPLSFLPGDLDRDGDIDIYDYNRLVSDFGKTGSSGFVLADIDKNGKVDIYDYNVLVENFGKQL